MIMNVYAQNENNITETTLEENTTSSASFAYNYKDPIEFVHGIEVDIDGVKYYFDGPADASRWS